MTEPSADGSPLRVVGYDDWHGLFYGNELICEGHSIELWDVFKVANNRPVSEFIEEGGEALGDWLMERGGFNCAYDEIPVEALASED